MFRRIRETQAGHHRANGTEPHGGAGAGQATLPPPSAPAGLPTTPQQTDLRSVASERLSNVGKELSVDLSADAKRRKRLLELRVQMHGKLLDTLNLSAIEKVSEAELRQEIHEIVREELAHGDLVLTRPELERLVKDLVHEVIGLGPLEPLLADDTITDILVNTNEQCYVERHGKLELTEVQFKDNQHLMRVINKIVAAVGRRV
ncbi:MAG: CpaF family protein, partial [Pseudomonadota bacterium]